MMTIIARRQRSALVGGRTSVGFSSPQTAEWVSKYLGRWSLSPPPPVFASLQAPTPHPPVQDWPPTWVRPPRVGVNPPRVPSRGFAI
ncbi:unnamed protein product [Mesocestoides corti]|uniref:Uncharacterized protein n=1 Tax=Mesocestoides corti TaxID=53468 RepID=A0A0R3UHW9_MESCO|nr:unnamed protein product [Mesocestoides corti]